MSAKQFIPTAVLVFMAFMLHAQEPGFVASAPATVQVGQQFQYTVEGNERGDVQLPELENFDLLAGPFANLSSSTQWINGKMTAKTTASYTYVLRGNHPGNHTIPPAQVKVKRESYATNAVEISVTGSASGTASPSASSSGNQTGTASQAGNSTVEGESEQPVFLRVLPSKTSVYIGEQLVSELKVYTSVNTRPAGGLKEVPYEGFYKHALEADQTSSRENIGGKPHVTQVLQRHVLIPQKTGKLVIEPFKSEWTVPQRVTTQRPRSMFDDFFNDPFFDRVHEVPVEISTKPVTINVKPLPGNAPAGFTGGVGDLKFTAKLSDDQVTVNDAVSLVVTISGTGNISLIGAPKIDFPPDHDLYETTKSTKISTSENRVSGSVTFEYPIVARHAGKYRIAPVGFSWFDPAAGRYMTTTTEEFNFTVEKGDGMESGGEIYMPGIRGDEVQDIGTDILDIRRTVPLFTVAGRSPLDNSVYWIIYILLFILFLVVAFTLRIYYKRNADVRLIRNRKASKMAKSRLRIANKACKANDMEKFFEETERAIWGYLSDKLTIELSSLSRDSASEVLAKAGVSEDIQSEMIRIIDDCEFSRYAPSSEKSDMQKLYNDAVSLLHNLEQNIRVR
ncbi:MAG: BatD family protein [Bacteroidales bacterium]